MRFRSTWWWTVLHFAGAVPILLLAIPSQQRWKSLALILVGHMVALGVVFLARNIAVPARLHVLPAVPDLSPADEEAFETALFQAATKGPTPASRAAIAHYARLGHPPARLAHALILLQVDPGSRWLQPFGESSGDTGHPCYYRTALVRYIVLVGAARFSAAAAVVDEAIAEWHVGPVPDSTAERRAFDRLSSLAGFAAGGALTPRALRDAALDVEVDIATGTAPLLVAEDDPTPYVVYSEPPEKGRPEALQPDQFTLVQGWVRAAALRIERLGLRWPTVAVTSALAYVVSAVLVAEDRSVRLASIPLGIAAFLDIFDAHLAERMNRHRHAVLYDYYLDRLAEAALAAGFFSLIVSSYDFVPWMPLIFGMASMYLPYARAEASRLGVPTDGDIFDRGIRNVVLIGGMAVGRPIYALSLATALTLHASLRRTGSAMTAAMAPGTGAPSDDKDPVR